MLAVFAMVVGVFLMHGLSGDHDLNSGPNAGSRITLSAPVGAALVMDAGAGHEGMAAPRDTGGPAGAGDHAPGGHRGHGVAGACLALLAALLGLAGAPVLPGSVWRGSASWIRPRAGLTQAQTWSPWCCAPSLSALGLSRT